MDWVKRSGRRNVSLIGSAELPDGTSTRVLLSDLSYEGCQLVAEQDLEVGEVIRLTIPDMGTMQAWVRWVVDGKVGLRFALGGSVTDDRRLRIGV
jgi:hypothetical protein